MFRFIYPRAAVRTSAAIAAAALAVGLGGCQQQDNPVTFSVSVPQPNVIGFQATLTQHYGLGLAGSFNLPNDVGQIVLVAESPSSGFGLGVNLNTRAFLRDSWVQFQEVSTLPTGAYFPTWMGVPVVDVTSPDLNQYGVDYHFYLGTRGTWYLGAAGVIHAIDEHFPAVNIGYTFYDKQGRVVIGFQFFGPRIGPDGKAQVPGGIFIGTNLSPFLPPELQPRPPSGPSGNVAVSSSALTIQGGELFELARKASRGQPVVINGQSVVSDIQTSGRDAHRYRSNRAIRGLIDRYMQASRRTK